jgi:hypothetical protein
MGMGRRSQPLLDHWNEGRVVHIGLMNVGVSTPFVPASPCALALGPIAPGPRTRNATSIFSISTVCLSESLAPIAHIAAVFSGLRSLAGSVDLDW